MAQKIKFHNQIILLFLFNLYSNQICHDITPKLNALNEKLMLAISIGDYNGAKKAIANGANVNYKNNYQTTPLDLAVHLNKTDMVKLLLDNGTNIDSKNAQGKSALINAAGKGSLSVVQLLVERGASVDITYYDTVTKNNLNAMQIAALEGYNDIVDFLKKYKVDRKKEIAKTTPLIPDLAEIVVNYELKTKK